MTVIIDGVDVAPAGGAERSPCTRESPVRPAGITTGASRDRETVVPAIPGPTRSKSEPEAETAAKAWAPPGATAGRYGRQLLRVERPRNPSSPAAE